MNTDGADNLALSSVDEMRTRLEQQVAVADLGRLARSGCDLQSLFERAAQLLIDHLGADLSSVLELLPDGKSAQARAGAGALPEQCLPVAVGKTASLAGYSLAIHQPVTSSDLTRETRFALSEHMRKHSVISGVSAVIGLAPEAWGVLMAHSKTQRDFDRSEVTFVQSVANVLAAAIAQDSATREINFQALCSTAWSRASSATDLEGTIEYWSEQAESLYGWSAAEAIGQNVNALLYEPERQQDALKHFERVASGEHRAGEDRARTRDGRTLPIMISESPIHDRQGRRVGVVGITADISDRKQSEEALRASEELGRRVISSLSSLVAVLDPDGTIVMANDAWIRFAGESPGRVHARLGGNYLEATRAWATRNPDVEAGIAGLESVLAGDCDKVELEYAADGSEGRSWVLATITPLGGQGGGAIVSHSDITDLKLAQESLRQNNQYLAALHETSIALMNRLDTDDLLQAIVNRTGQLLAASDVVVYLADRGGSEMTLRVASGLSVGWKGTRLERGVGLTGRVWETEQELVVNDYQNWEGRLERYTSGGFQSAAAVPLKSGDRVLGVLGVGRCEEGRPFEAKEMSLLQGIAELVSIALDNAALYEAASAEIEDRRRAERELEERLAQQAAVTQFGREALEDLDLEDLFERVVQAAMSTLGTDSASLIGLASHGGVSVRAWAAVGPTKLLDRILNVSPSDPQVVYAMKAGAPVIVDDLEHESRFVPSPTLLEAGVKSTMGMAVQGPDAIFGTLGVQCRTSRTFSEYDANFLRALAHTVSAALRRRSAEDALLAHEERYRDLFENASDVLWVRSQEGNFISVNRAFERLTGYSREEARTLTVSRLLDSERMGDMTDLQEQLEGRDHTPFEICFVTRDGRQLELEVSNRLVYENGEAVAVQAIARDVSERQRAEKDAQERRRWQALSSAVALAVGAPMPLEAALEACGRAIVENLHCDIVRIWILDPRSQKLRLAAAAGANAPMIVPPDGIPLGRYVAGRVAATSAPEFGSDLQNDEELGEWALETGTVSHAGFPLQADGEVAGAITVFSSLKLDPSAFDGLALVVLSTEVGDSPGE
ncbi:MAG: PAS domain S-box protein [Dehalococcoidia bacterium]|nr:PAS domain S-box protein [Dehalococcoidia bacterium]